MLMVLAKRELMGVGIRIYSKNTTTDGLIKLNTQTPE